MTYKTVLFDVSDGVATISLNRPDRLNTFTQQLLRELAEAVAEAEANSAVRAVLLRGEGRAFCAGQDLSERALTLAQGNAPNIRDSLRNYYNPLIKALRNIPVPVVCAVNGAAAGAGANLALACDIVLAGRTAIIVQAFCKIGLIPDAGGTYILPRLVGQARAMGLSMLGDEITGEQAEDWGMIWKCTDDDQLDKESRALAVRLAAGPTKALGLAKRALNASLDNTLDEQLEVECTAQQAAGLSKDFTEGVTAFLDKRPPVFKGD